MYLDNNFDYVDMFEKKIAKFTGSKYAISVDCASHGIFLTLKYINKPQTITIPCRTYFSVPMQILHAGYSVKFVDKFWEGGFQLEPLNVFDMSLRLNRDMYIPETFQILSFQHKKKLSLNRGGMILTDNEDAYLKLKLLRYDGRDLTKRVAEINDIETIGYHMYMTPEVACDGLLKLNMIQDKTPDIYNSNDYHDLSKFTCFKNHPNVEI